MNAENEKSFQGQVMANEQPELLNSADKIVNWYNYIII